MMKLMNKGNFSLRGKFFYVAPGGIFPVAPGDFSMREDFSMRGDFSIWRRRKFLSRWRIGVLLNNKREKSTYSRIE